MPAGRHQGTVEELNAESQAALAILGQTPSTLAFEEPKTRRCQACFEFFQCGRIEDIVCSDCGQPMPEGAEA